ncbi:NtaA/DmoA family FMN-dependent monooxygenase [Paracoccus sp. p3-h83]|uniref:NtaA/DmoA family FMN-dependent monooxygenase n=1 Tax=Paracoccus sp. p3-h83 TaxID=3342805 RepID=UPI0035BB324F
MTRTLTIGLSLSPTWLSGNGWRRADSGVQDLFTPAAAIEIARQAEAAHLDFVFRADSLHLDPAAVATGPGFAALDPTLMMTAVAGATSRIGLVTTASALFYPAYILARQVASLHWISDGRAGWNLVTALDGARNFGQADLPPPDARYAQAEVVLAQVRRLWDSFPQAAMILDRAAGRFADPAQLVLASGDPVEGPLTLPAHPSGPPPIFQAGASAAGRDFAARQADAIFAATPDRDAAVSLRADLRDRSRRAGRDPDAVRVLPGLSLYLGATRDAAESLYHDTHAGADRRRRLAMVRAQIGLDLTDLPGDQPVTPDMLPQPPAHPRSRTHAALLARMIARDRPTVDDLLARPEVAASGHWQVIGTPDDAVARIADWQAAGAIDGFVALPGGSRDCLSLLLTQVVPRLAEAGLFRRAYAGRTLRDHLGLA